jgi:hypothetical protein
MERIEKRPIDCRSDKSRMATGNLIGTTAGFPKSINQERPLCENS